MVEPLDGTLKGGLLLQTGLVGSIEGRFEVTIINPTSDEVWLRSRSPVGRMYTVDVIDRNPEHIVEFQEWLTVVFLRLNLMKSKHTLGISSTKG